MDQVHLDSSTANLMYHLIVVNDRISNPIMRRIGRHIIHFLNPRNKQKTSIGFTWKEAHGLYLDNVYKIDATYPLALALQLNEVSVISLYVHVFNLNVH